jgi:Zn-dependent oligopeptidase
MSNADFSRYYPVDPDTGFLASFEHLFAGYDAGYYGYAWADVIAADIAGTFRDSPAGFHDEELGQRLRRTLYARGNTREAEASIREYLGRDFNDKAFLEELFTAP